MALEVFQDGFEDGQGAAWPTRTGAWEITADAAHEGDYGLRLSGLGVSGAHFATSTVKWSQTNRPYAHLDLWFRCLQVPALGTSMGLVTLQNTAGVNHFDFFVSNLSGALRWDLEGAISWHDSGVVPELGRWYHFEAVVYYGDSTYWADVRLDGVQHPRIESPGSTPTSTRSLHLGSNSGAQGQWEVDQVYIGVSDEELSLPDLPPASGSGFLPDNMSTKLASLYPALPDAAARYYQWIQDNGPEWWDIINYVETETSLPFSDGWHAYWTS